MSIVIIVMIGVDKQMWDQAVAYQTAPVILDISLAMDGLSGRHPVADVDYLTPLHATHNRRKEALYQQLIQLKMEVYIHLRWSH
jgi:hypothetical protein